jgi:hypothetical protein
MNTVAAESDAEAQSETRRLHRASGYVLAGLGGALVGALVVAFATKALPTVMSKAMRQMMTDMMNAGGPCGDG